MLISEFSPTGVAYSTEGMVWVGELLDNLSRSVKSRENWGTVLVLPFYNRCGYVYCVDIPQIVAELVLTDQNLNPVLCIIGNRYACKQPISDQAIALIGPLVEAFKMNGIKGALEKYAKMYKEWVVCGVVEDCAYNDARELFVNDCTEDGVHGITSYIELGGG